MGLAGPLMLTAPFSAVVVFGGCGFGSGTEKTPKLTTGSTGALGIFMYIKHLRLRKKHQNVRKMYRVSNGVLPTLTMKNSPTCRYLKITCVDPSWIMPS